MITLNTGDMGKYFLKSILFTIQFLCGTFFFFIYKVGIALPLKKILNPYGQVKYFLIV